LADGLGQKKLALEILERAAQLAPDDIQLKQNVRGLQAPSQGCLVVCLYPCADIWLPYYSHLALHVERRRVSTLKDKGIMKKILLLSLFAFALFFTVKGSSETETKPANTPSEPDRGKPGFIGLKPGEPHALPYDAGAVRFLASSGDTNGAWSLVELTEMPGYKTNLHRHNHTDEAFYVLEGVLTVRIDSTVSEYPAGSYILIPRGTPHAQGNGGKAPARILLAMTPGGFERSFKDRAELFKTAKPNEADFRQKRKENAVKGNYDVEFLADWELPK
jgi:quercetin dioxygenase-like cupin family protein